MKRTLFAFETSYIMNRSGLASLLVTALIALGACAGPTDHDRLVAARVALEEGRIEQARADADAVRKTSPDDPEARRILAAVYRRLAEQNEEQGALQKAHSNFVRAAELEPFRERRALDYWAAWKNGQDAGLDDTQLVELLLASLEANPSDLTVRRAAASSYDELNDLNNAIVHYLWVWEADRADVPVGLRLGNLYFAQGELQDAEAVFSRILERDPKNVQAQLRMADIYEAKGRGGRAHQVYRELDEANPDNAMILFRYAEFLERAGDLEQAEQVRAQARGELPGVQRREMRELKKRKKKRK